LIECLDQDNYSDIEQLLQTPQNVENSQPRGEYQDNYSEIEQLLQTPQNIENSQPRGEFVFKISDTIDDSDDSDPEEDNQSPVQNP